MIDCLVIGGGVTGAGVALDAATRGLSTVLVEAQDYASGTSQWSTKLVHGGLRYLQMLDFKLVHEALTERGLLLTKLAPHLVKPMPFLIPLEHRVWQRAYYGAGVTLYDALANIMPGRRALPIHRHRTRKGLKRKFPDLKHETAIGAVEYFDATVDDARLVATLVRTAVTYGAQAANRTQVVEITKDDHGRADGAVLVDLETDTRIVCKATHIINCTGVWTDDVEKLAHTEGGLEVLASKGIHIIVPRERLSGTLRRAAADREVGALLRAVVPLLDHRHHGHDLGPGPAAPGRHGSRHRLRPRPRQRGADHRPDPGGRHRLVRRTATAAPARHQGGHELGEGQPGAHRGQPDPRPDRHRRRQADDVPDHGQGRSRLRPGRPRREARLHHRRDPPARCRRRGGHATAGCPRCSSGSAGPT